MGAIFGTLPSGTQKQPRFYQTFQNCSGLTGSIPAGLFGNLTGAPATYMFNSTFAKCSNLTGYIDGRLFSGITGTLSSAYSTTFFGASKMDTECPNNTYNVDKPNTSWTVAVCNPCPDTHQKSDSVAESINMCYTGQTCDSGMYYDATVTACATCPEKFYCTGGTNIMYYDGTVSGDGGVATACPTNVTSPTGSTSIDACMCAAGFEFNSSGACGALCGAGFTKLRTDSGLSIPIFATKNTSPSINFGYNGTICYADLVAGQTPGAINVNYNGQIYHAITLHQRLRVTGYDADYQRT